MFELSPRIFSSLFRQAADAREGEAGFLAEVSVTGSIEHPNVLPVLGVAVDTPQAQLPFTPSALKMENDQNIIQ